MEKSEQRHTKHLTETPSSRARRKRCTSTASCQNPQRDLEKQGVSFGGPHQIKELQVVFNRAPESVFHNLKK
jgi:hypothetical protein